MIVIIKIGIFKNDKAIRYCLAVNKSWKIIWPNGAIIKDNRIEIPLKGSSYVPIDKP